LKVFNHRDSQRRHRVAQKFSLRLSQILVVLCGKKLYVLCDKKWIKVLSLLFFKYRSQNGFLSEFSSHPKGRLGTTGRRHKVAQRFSLRFSQTLRCSVAKNFVCFVVKNGLSIELCVFQIPFIERLLSKFSSHPKGRLGTTWDNVGVLCGKKWIKY
jgi:hypothetical protein